MKKEKYIRMREYISDRPELDNGINTMDELLTWFIYFSYIFTSLALVIKKSRKAVPFIMVPASVYLSGSLLRSLVNAKRPYEEMELKLNPKKKKKDSKGESMPSRHAFSAAVIAMSFCRLDKRMGIIMIPAALCMAASRVLSGLHWIKDVLAGLCYGFMGAMIGWKFLSGKCK